MLDSAKLLLVSGLSGKSWRLQKAGVDLLARESRRQKIQLGVDRCLKFRLLCALNGSGQAPHPRGIAADWLLVKWLPAEPTSALCVLLANQRFDRRFLR